MNSVSNSDVSLCKRVPEGPKAFIETITQVQGPEVNHCPHISQLNNQLCVLSELKFRSAMEIILEMSFFICFFCRLSLLNHGASHQPCGLWPCGLGLGLDPQPGGQC